MITRDRALELLDVDIYTGILVWKPIPDLSVHDKRRNSCIAGRLAGKITGKDGRRRVRLDTQSYPVADIIWLVARGVLPKERLDHKNRDSSDNSIENLREASPTQNNGNMSRRSDNKTGYRGVSVSFRSKKFLASIQIHGKSVRIGRYDSAEDAARAYDTAASTHFGEFANLNFGGASV